MVSSFKYFIENLNAYSWLDPKGNFNPIPNNGSHSTEASKMIQPRNSSITAMDELYLLGWQRINFFSNDLYCSNRFKKPNETQLRNLIDFALENRRFDKIIYDNEEDEIVLWKMGE